MQLHQIKSKTIFKSKKRVGRGGKRGTYSGRGLKGQKSRAGGKLRPQLRDIIKRIPKKRGYKFNSLQDKGVVVNLNILEKMFESAEEVTPQILVEKKIIRKQKGHLPKVKILGMGKLTKKIIISNCNVSDSAREKIIKAEGKVS